MWIVLAWIEEDFRVVSDSGYDLGNPVKTSKFFVGKSSVWKRNADENDLKRAQEYSQKETFGNLDQHPQIFTYPDKEDEPLNRARKDVLKTLKGKKKLHVRFHSLFSHPPSHDSGLYHDPIFLSDRDAGLLHVQSEAIFQIHDQEVLK